MRILVRFTLSAALIVSAGCRPQVRTSAGPELPKAPTPIERAASTPTVVPDRPDSVPRAETPAPVERPASPPVRSSPGLAEELSRLQDAFFDYDKSLLRGDARAALRSDVEILKKIFESFPDAKLAVEGHCDERGSSEYNLALGDQRARAARDFLVEFGVSAQRLQVLSYGKERPQCTERTEDCWQKNRRAHLTSSP